MPTHTLPTLIALLALAAPHVALAQPQLQQAPPGGPEIVAPPLIEGALSVPGLSTTHPGARVYLKGEHFHQGPGVIAIHGTVGGQEKSHALQDVKWKSDGQANGVVPYDTVEFSGDRPVYVQIIRKAQASNRVKMYFQPILIAQIEEQEPQQLANPLEQNQQLADPLEQNQQLVDPLEPVLAIAEVEGADQNLDDWNPYGEEGGVPSVRVTKPSFNAVLPPTQGGVVLQLAHQGGVAPPRVMIEFARLTEAPESIGDIKLPTEHSHMWQPTHAYERDFTQAPMPLNFAGPIFRGQEGHYQVRARGKASKTMGGWSAWKPFCVGSQQGCTQLSQLAQGAQGTQAFIDKQVEKSFESLTLGTARTSGPAFEKTAGPELGGHATRAIARSQAAPPGPKVARISPATAPNASGLPKTRIAVAAQPKLSVVAVPVPGGSSYVEGRPFSMKFTIRNSGNAPTDTVRYGLSCQVVSGGPRCFSRKSGVVQDIAPDGETKVEFENLVLDAGDYGLELAVQGGPSQRVRIRVAPAAVPRAVPSDAVKKARPGAVRRVP